MDLKGSSFLKEENFSLKRKVNSFTKDLEKFIKGRENLDLILGIQKYSLDKEGLGYSYSNCEKYYKNFFFKSLNFFKTFCYLQLLWK